MVAMIVIMIVIMAVGVIVPIMVVMVAHEDLASFAVLSLFG
jgi:hypothetical protein